MCYGCILSVIKKSGNKLSDVLLLVGVKGNMHHKYDVSSKDGFHVINMDARIYSKKFAT